MNLPLLQKLGRYVRATTSICALCGCLNSTSFAADNPEPVNWDRARELLHKSQQGGQFSPEDQACLDHAKAVRAKAGKAGSAGPTAPAPRETTGMVPLDQMAAQDTYKGQDGGLYGGGKNQPPPLHLKAALAEAAKIVPRDPDGKPSADGKIVLLTIGMSNTAQESAKFKEIADADPAKAPRVVIVDGAQGGKDAALWSDDQSPTWQVAESRLKASGVNAQQVQAIWMKHARIASRTIRRVPQAQ